MPFSLPTPSALIVALERWWESLGEISVFWPTAIAGAATVLVCVAAAVIMLDSWRRSAGVPTWTYLRSSVASLVAEQEGRKRALDALWTEAEALEAKVSALRSAETKLALIEQDRKQAQETLSRLRSQLENFDTDRATLESLHTDLDEARREEAVLRRSTIQLQEERAQRQESIDLIRNEHVLLKAERGKTKQSLEAASTALVQRKQELDGLQRQIDNAKAVLREATQRKKRETDSLEAIERERGRLKGQEAVLAGQIDQLNAHVQDLQEKAEAAQAARIRMAEDNGRLDAERSSLWVEFLALQEKRSVAQADLGAVETRLRDLRLERDALHGEIRMLKAVMGGIDGIAGLPRDPLSGEPGRTVVGGSA